MDEMSLLELKERIGSEHLGQRLRIQVDRNLEMVGDGVGGFHFENIPLFVELVSLGLRMTGLEGIGKKNAQQFKVHDHHVSLKNLPASFNSLRILHLSDLHIDCAPGFGRCVAQAIHGLQFDLCLVTGDYRFFDTGRYFQIIEEMEALMPVLQCQYGVYGILGNHDFIELVPVLEKLGVKMLLNEAVPIQRGTETLWIVGLDDAHFYGLHDFDKALRSIPENDTRLLMLHSPEQIPQAAARGFSLYLTGHTHAGQLCLPGGVPVMLNAHCARKYTKGAWTFNDMQGYTSAGVGCSGVFARYFCPPEIVVHVLHTRS